MFYHSEKFQIPEEDGGQGYGVLENALVVEAFCRKDSGPGIALSLADSSSEMTLRFGSDQQKKNYLVPIARGQAISSGAFTEPDHGSDIPLLNTTAIKQGDEFVINGLKTFISNGTIGNLVIVLCQTNPKADPTYSGQSAIVVEKETAGYTSADAGEKMGNKMSPTGELSFNDVRVSLSNLVGEENRGFCQALQLFEEIRIEIGAQAVGVAQGAFDRALAYAKQRSRFGKRLEEFQVTRHKSETQNRIREELNDRTIEVATIGRAGEGKVLFASTSCDGRMFGRGGSGAVMGSKNLKAISLKGRADLPWFKSAPFLEQTKKAMEKIRTNPMTQKGGMFPKFGTTFTIEATQNGGVLPTRNWQEGIFERAESLFSRSFFERKIRSTTCPHCPIGCGRIVRTRDRTGDVTNEGPEYETIYAFGSNCGIDDPDTIIEADWLCEEYGLDTISCGVVISFLMECSEKGILSSRSGEPYLGFGDSEGLLETIRLIGESSGLWKLLGRGVRRLSEEIGPETKGFAMSAKGLELPGYDPRGMKAMALLYATSDRGGCHLRGSTLRSELLGLPTPVDRCSSERDGKRGMCHGKSSREKVYL